MLVDEEKMSSTSTTIHVAASTDVPELVALMRIYCDTSDEPHVAKPSTADLFELCQRILNDAEREGLYLIARSTAGVAVGFASLFWSWSLIRSPGRQAILSDLFVHSEARGQCVAGLLIRACAEQARRFHVRSIIWQTSMDNHSAQRTYQRLGIDPRRCADYEFVLFNKH